MSQVRSSFRLTPPILVSSGANVTFSHWNARREKPQTWCRCAACLMSQTRPMPGAEGRSPLVKVVVGTCGTPSRRPSEIVLDAAMRSLTRSCVMRPLDVSLNTSSRRLASHVHGPAERTSRSPVEDAFYAQTPESLRSDARSDGR